MVGLVTVCRLNLRLDWLRWIAVPVTLPLALICDLPFTLPGRWLRCWDCCVVAYVARLLVRCCPFF